MSEIITGDISNHVAQALAQLPEEYKNLPLLQGFLTAFVNRIQEAENALIQLRDQRISLTPGVVVGENLDLMGGIVGQDRTVGQSDTNYLSSILVKIAQNSSLATPESIILICSLITGGTNVNPIVFTDANVAIQFTGGSIANPAAIYGAIQAGLAAGVQLVRVSQTAPVPFRYLEDPFFGAGYNDDNPTDGVGGAFATDI